MACGHLSRSLTRRHVLLGATAIAANALAAACGGGSSATDTPKPAPTTAAVIPAPIAATSAAPSSPATTVPTAPPTVAPTAAAPAASPVTPSAALAATPVSTSPFIAFVGSSTTRGVGADAGKDYPSQMVALLAPTHYEFVNLGIDNEVSAEFIQRAPQNVDPLYNPTHAKNIVVLWGNLDNAPRTYACGAVPIDKIYDNFATFCKARKAVGWKTVTLTTFRQRNNFAFDEFESGIALNAKLRATWQEFCDTLVDVMADPRLGADGAQNNTQYFRPDGMHMTGDGYAIVAEMVKAAILKL